MHGYTEEAHRGRYGSEWSITSGSRSPALAAFHFNPRARPFIPGAISHPPVPVWEKPTHPTGSLLNPTALAFVPVHAAFNLPPSMVMQFQQEFANPQDPFFDSFADANVTFGMFEGPPDFYDQDVHQSFVQHPHYVFGIGVANPYDSGSTHYANEEFAPPAVQPVFALDPQHAFVHHSGSGARKYSVTFDSHPALRQINTGKRSKKSKAKKAKAKKPQMNGVVEF